MEYIVSVFITKKLHLTLTRLSAKVARLSAVFPHKLLLVIAIVNYGGFLRTAISVVWIIFTNCKSMYKCDIMRFIGKELLARLIFT